jgi:hypothetical protein
MEDSRAALLAVVDSSGADLSRNRTGESYSFPNGHGGTTRSTLPGYHVLKIASPRFEHRPVRGMPPRMESYCLAFGKFIATSADAEVLRVAEKAHICPQRKRKQ